MNTSPSTKSHPSPYDGFAKAEPDELIFTLIERDTCAPGAILAWVDLRRAWARENCKGEKLDAEMRQCTEAEFLAFAMRDRQKGMAEKHEGPARVSYDGTRDNSGEEWRETLSLATQNLRNAAADIRDATEAFEKLELLDNDDRVMLQSALNIVNQIASEREPKRASFSEQPTLESIKEQAE